MFLNQNVKSKWRVTTLAAFVILVTGALICAPTKAASSEDTQTSIKHLVIIFQENVSFDHYFAAYPNALNKADEPIFSAKPLTPSVNGLSGLLNSSTFGPSTLAATTLKMGGKNIGDLLNAKGVSWGAFMGGFDLTLTNADGSTG